ncbi:carbohydrate kinase family protein [Formosa haliotis]|uniref:carbohydrate kinase family protein n=1 Tax=Formosa haliotis TaxID=1555194 RepID=UPI000826F17C|nr:carbohydrate kinase [Formosa haliotis]
MINVVCFGEVLWDVFPNHRKIGGAPLNVANRLSAFNNNVSIISRVGDDKNGAQILNTLKEGTIRTEGVQVDQEFKTGEVNVMLNEAGSASYDILFPRAWDNIQVTEMAKSIIKESDAFIFGSLIARDEVSRETLYALLKLADYKIFDVNLRPPHYTIEVLKKLMNEADFIKFNDDEIFEISKSLEFNAETLEENIRFIARETNTTSICVTRGAHGAILSINDTFYYNDGYKIKVIDTVGAGDSFLATLINKLFHDASPQDAINYACAVGALVAGRSGANPEFTNDEVVQFIKSQ